MPDPGGLPAAPRVIEAPAPLDDARRTRGLVALMLSATIGLIGQFMVTPLMIFLLEARGVAPSRIGLFGATVWIGILVATPQAARLVALLGHRRALLLSFAVPCVTMSGIALTDSLWIWTPLYFLAGMAVSVRWVVGEAAIAELAPGHRRGRIVGLYQTLLGAAFVIAPVLLAWLGPTQPSTPWIALVFPFAGLLITLAVPRLPTPRAGTGSGYRGLLGAARAMPLAVVAGVFGGFFELGIATMLPIYGLAIGMTTAGAALLLSASGLGSSLFMLPLGEAADRFSGRRVMHACAALTLLAALLLPVTVAWPALAWPLAFFWGGAGGALYTLAMIEIGHRHKGHELIASTSLLVVCYTIGGVIGPIVTGAAIELSPSWAVPATFTLAAAAGWAALSAATRRARTAS